MRTMPARRLRKDEIRSGRLLLYPEAERPRTRRDCQDGERPCPFVSCKWHLYLDADPETGSLRFNFPDREPWDLEETCALDVADRGGMTLERVAQLINLTRERVRQLELAAGEQARRAELDMTSENS